MKGMLIRIKNKGEKFQKSLSIRTLARIVILPSYIKRFNMFFSFLKKYMKLSPKTYKTINEIIMKNLSMTFIVLEVIKYGIQDGMKKLIIHII